MWWKTVNIYETILFWHTCNFFFKLLNNSGYYTQQTTSKSHSTRTGHKTLCYRILHWNEYAHVYLSSEKGYMHSSSWFKCFGVANQICDPIRIEVRKRPQNKGSGCWGKNCWNIQFLITPLYRCISLIMKQYTSYENNSLFYLPLSSGFAFFH